MWFNSSEVVWILSNLAELSKGWWPDPDSIDGLPVTKKKLSSWKTYFAAPCDLIATVEMRIEQCGQDGDMARLYYGLSQHPEIIGRHYNLHWAKVVKRINSVIDYISNKWPKDGAYREFRDHKKYSQMKMGLRL